MSHLVHEFNHSDLTYFPSTVVVAVVVGFVVGKSWFCRPMLSWLASAIMEIRHLSGQPCVNLDALVMDKIG